MSHWVWLSRVTLLGLVGTATLATLFFSTRSLNLAPDKQNSDRLLATTIAPEEIQALKLSASPPATPDAVELTSPPSPLVGQENQSPPSIAKKGESRGLGLPSRKGTAPTPTTRLNRPNKVGGSKKVQKIPFDLKKSLMAYSPLFATPTSLGMVAIGVAEGNYQLVVKNSTLYVQPTPNYFGHTDPGNLSWGEVVSNYGPCSDQGRSGGNISLAEQMCLQRSRSGLPIQLADLDAAGINPNLNLEALLNAADLYNQASPIHSRYFPKALAIAHRGGLKGIEAIAWARTASFYLNLNNQLDLEKGSNQATGLLGICSRENRPITEWQCVYADQMRRVKAITAVLEKYRQKVQHSKIETD